ncbi:MULTISPECIES: LysR family transcriptional regulator [Mesorhizobium]|uniref:LysR family transcriptional regulator n=1 Tax=Mesorhizobium TaxID=68287 RepID=UPI0010A9727E|nr:MULTISPECIES: LysR family transcriptional regulator [Mesorhizobium]
MHSSILKYIDQVARLGSIRKAAGVLNVASSAVNRQILKLEADMGVTIFERHGNGVRLTPAGESVVQHARETLAKWQDMRRHVSSLTGNIHGEVKVISIPSVMVRILPRAIEATAKENPYISYRVIDASPRQNTEEMRAQRPDVAVQFIDERYKKYAVVARIRMRLGAIVNKNHPLAERDQVSLTECADFPVVMLNEPWILDATAEAEFVHSGAEFNPVVTTNSLQLTKHIISTGLGLGFFTPLGFIDELKSGELRHVPLAEQDLRASEIGLLVHSDRQGNAAVKAVCNNLKAQFVELERDLTAALR